MIFQYISRMRTIKVCAGIGDNIWLLMKLLNSGERFHFQLPNGQPQRGKQIFDLLPQVAASASYVPGLSYKKLAQFNVQNVHKTWRRIQAREFYLTCNEHLEHGHRLEDFLPDLPLSFRIPWQTHEAAAEFVSSLPTKAIGIYGSAYSTQRAWGFWDEHKWLELIQLVHRHDPEYTFVIIGASWDLDLGRNLVALLEHHRIPHLNTIGRNLAEVVEILKRLHYFYSFPSGLGILATTVGCPVTMFYPPHLEPMILAWPSLEDVESGNYKGTLFCEPREIFDWTVKYRKI